MYGLRRMSRVVIFMIHDHTWKFLFYAYFEQYSMFVVCEMLPVDYSYRFQIAKL